MCRSGELMQWGRVPCDGIVEARKCAACNLTRLGMPQPLARLAGMLPVPLSAALQRLPGRAGTALGMPASVREYEAMQRELFDARRPVRRVERDRAADADLRMARRRTRLC